MTSIRLARIAFCKRNTVAALALHAPAVAALGGRWVLHACLFATHALPLVFAHRSDRGEE
jgi:hypothetical protein